MTKEFTVHIFCVTPSLCKLICKSFSKTGFVVQCTNVTSFKEELIDDVNYNPDCIILDRDINIPFKDKIKSKFKDSEIIYLPSLAETEIPANAGNASHFKTISEPFKLSELSAILNDLYTKKQRVNDEE